MMKLTMILLYLGLCSFAQAEKIVDDQEFLNSVTKIAVICDVYTSAAFADTGDYAAEHEWWDAFLWNWLNENQLLRDALENTVVNHIGDTPDLAYIEAVALDCIHVRAWFLTKATAFAEE